MNLKPSRTVNPWVRRCRVLCLALVAAGSLTACFPLVLGGAMVGTTVVLTDRRTTGSQVEDEGIELKAGNRISNVLAPAFGRVSVTSYNQLVLITGEVTTEANRALVEQTVSRVEKVRSIVNEVVVVSELPSSTIGSETLLTSRVKAALIDSKDPLANVVKVVTARGTVYLMGRVTEQEATQAANTVRGVSGVQKVVRVFEVISEEELTKLKTAPAPDSSSKPAGP